MTDNELNKLKRDATALALRVHQYNALDPSEEAVELRRQYGQLHAAITEEEQRRDKLPRPVKPKPKITVR